MIYAVCVLIVISFAAAGRIISSRWIDRHEFFAALSRLVSELIGNLSFRQEKASEAVASSLGAIGRGRSRLEPIISALTTRDPKSLEGKLAYLSREERERVTSFVLQLGEGNTAVEKARLEGFESWLEQMVKQTKEERAKNAGVIYKLSIAIGVVISILII